MATSKLNPYDKVTILDWYEKGMYSQRELAEIYGVSRSTIQRVLEHAADFPVNPEIQVDRSSEQEVDRSSDDTPPAWLGVGLIALTTAAAGFVAWIIYNAMSYGN